MDQSPTEWRDDDGWYGTAERLRIQAIAISLMDNEGESISHVIGTERMGGILFGLMRLVSPDHPKPGEFWIVEVEGARRVVQVQDGATQETLQGEVKFLARVPMGEAHE